MKKFFNAIWLRIKYFCSNRYRVLSMFFVVVLLLPTFMFPVLRNFLATEKRELSENRDLNEFKPEFNNFGYLFENWYNDHIPFRKSFLYIYTELQHLIVGSLSESIEKGTGYLPVVIENGVIYGKEGWLFHTADDKERAYMGTNLPTKDEMAEIAKKLAEANAYFESINKKLIFQICPNKEQIYGEYMPNGYIVKTEYKRWDMLVDYIRANTRVQIAYTKNELIEKKKDFINYYKFDTHHNNLGAYIAYNGLQQKIGLDVINIDNLKVTGRLINGGNLADSLNKDLKGDQEFDVEYKSDVSILSRQTIFFPPGGGAVHTISKTISNSNNNQTLLFIGDSFRVNQLQYAYKDFSTVIEAHLDHLQNAEFNDEFISAFAQADVIILSATECYEGKLLQALQRLTSFI